MTEVLKEYRKHLVDARQKAFDDFDKTVIALSAGSLGISITFLKDLLGPGTGSLTLVIIAWGSWGLSVVSVLLSYFVSQMAIDETIAQIDSGEHPDKPGGRYALGTKVLNAAGGILFLSGLILFIIFVAQNMEVLNVRPK